MPISLCEVLHELSCVFCLAMHGYIVLFVSERLCVVFIMHVGHSTQLCVYISVHVASWSLQKMKCT